jgi:hypothetical protein
MVWKLPSVGRGAVGEGGSSGAICPSDHPTTRPSEEAVANDLSPHEDTVPASMKAISLFTGAGGLDLGCEAAGFMTVAAVENDPVARQTLEANSERWMPCLGGILGDIVDLEPAELLERANLVWVKRTLSMGGHRARHSRRAAIGSRTSVRARIPGRSLVLRPTPELWEVPTMAESTLRRGVDVHQRQSDAAPFRRASHTTPRRPTAHRRRLSL